MVPVTTISGILIFEVCLLKEQCLLRGSGVMIVESTTSDNVNTRVI